MNAGQYDVIVAGGGPAGIGAAVAAGEMGARTALVERHAFLGGMGTAALVNNFCRAHFHAGRSIIGGVFGRLRANLIVREAIYTASDLEPYDPEVFVEEATALATKAGVEVLMGRQIASVDFGGRAGARVRTQEGDVLAAKTVVDATGDAFVAFAAGVPFTFGREGDHAVMPLTYCYMIGPIDLAMAKRETPEFIRHDGNAGDDYYFLSGWHPEVDRKIAEARARDELEIPRDHISTIASVPGKPWNATVNFGRVTVADPTDAGQLAVAEVEGMRQVSQGVEFFRRNLPGFRKIELLQLAPRIGVRESRQIVAEHTLTGEEVLAGTQFKDAIAQCCYPVDIHHPGSDKTTMTRIGGPGHYDIPWRCLVPKSGPGNLVVGGRCIGATHEAMSSFRVSPSVMAIGEAAGVTAALAARDGRAIRDVDPQAVRERLLAAGGILS